MRWKLSLAVWAAAVIGVPAGVCAVYNCCTGLLREDFNTTVSLYLSMVSIMVTIFLTWYVYRSEQRRNELAAKREEEDAKRMVVAVLWIGLRQIIYRTGGYLKITDELIHAAASASRSLSIEQSQTLNECMYQLQNIGDTELNDWSEAHEKAWQFALTFLPEPAELFQERILETKNWEWLVGGAIRELLASLGSPFASRPEIVQDRNGQAVFQEYEPGRYRVWAEDGRVLLDGAVQGEDVLDGYAEIYDRFEHRRYLGQYMDSYRHGYGIEYFKDEDENIDYISKEGQWKKGELVDGIVYHVLLNDSESEEEEEGEPYHRSPYDWILQLETPERVQANVDYFPPFRMCDVQMVQGEVRVIEESIQTVEEFCENWKPHTQPIGPSLFERREGHVKS